MQRASITVDFNHARCGGCKVILDDELAKLCPVCGASFDRITSNHVGLAGKLLRMREAAGVAFTPSESADADEPEIPSAETSQSSGSSSSKIPTASINIDFSNMRCSNCKVLLTDELAATLTGTNKLEAVSDVL